LTVAATKRRVDESRGDRMDLPSTLILIMVGGAVLAWLAVARNGRALDAFGLGFIGYRSYGWPRGVQEEEPVHFSFDAGGPSGLDDGPAGIDAEPELIELDSPPDDWIRLERPH
jgi:hypothetical protein